MKQHYYSTKRIDSTGARYRIIFGERSNGKTYACLQKALEKFYETGEQFAYLRRWDEDIRQKRMQQLFAGHIQNGLIRKLSKGRNQSIAYKTGAFYPVTIEEHEDEKPADEFREPVPAGYAFSLTAVEHDKSTSYPNVTTIIFDECLTRRAYLPDEFVTLMNVLSTLIRDRDNVVIYMLGNTVNKYAPYFDEMGLNKIANMKPGDLDIYEYGNTGLTVAVEYADSAGKGKASDVYFAFDNPKLQMITSGAWEIALYPHNTVHYKPKDVVFNYFIDFQNELLQADMIVTDELTFTVIHRKTSQLKAPDEDLIFSLQSDPRPNWRRNIMKPTDRTTQIIYSHFQKDLVYYQDNTVGEIVRNYLIACSKSTMIKA